MTIQQIFDTDIPKDQFIIVSAGQAPIGSDIDNNGFSGPDISGNFGKIDLPGFGLYFLLALPVKAMRYVPGRTDDNQSRQQNKTETDQPDHTVLSMCNA